MRKKPQKSHTYTIFTLSALIVITGGGVFALLETEPEQSPQTVQTESSLNNQSTQLRVENGANGAGQLYSGQSINPHQATPSPQSASGADAYEAADDPQNPVTPRVQ